MTALHLAPQPVVLLSRAPLGTDASSTLAQGGLAASLTRASVAAIAAIGVDLISVGWLTHSAPILDIGLEIPPDRNCNRHLN
ncbi:carboxylating nicotinate-nucleotide diphosphorylase, partial [Bradyrhizobium sp. Arg314]